ncbi:MAG: SPFH domain-containing protein [Duncaniella sp.]|nr:SPFH domain-containing protein [Duncaniella sp.]HBI59167.1 band 7 protein [Porphyromonadaceae bacterium]
MEHKECPFRGMCANGFGLLAVQCVLIPALIAVVNILFLDVLAITIPVSIILGLLWCILWGGFFVQQPNQSRVMIFFGEYRGTFHKTGFYWCNPFMSRKKMSLRIRNMDIEPIKVNDKIGNPVLIGMVLVWKVKDTYRAVFDVDTPDISVLASGTNATEHSSRRSALEEFVRIQSDAALREVTGQFAYDETDNSAEEITLRGGGDEINDLLEHKINERLAMAGIEVVEARLNYLAYAPEIAAVMLRRQQASAIIAAREKIVEGAVSMVKMAFDQLSEEQIVELDEERKAAMVSNLLVVLCADEPAQPVLNTGTLYQ